jgi:hypothetical protein
MYLDGSPIFPEDQVYDLVYGPGVVQKLLPAENRFIVNFGNRVIGYRTNGTGLFTSRTLFWHNPIPGPPPKDARAFGFYRELCVCLSKFCAEQTDLVNKILESNTNGA